MAYANTEDDVITPSAGGPSPRRNVLLTPRNFELLEYTEYPHSPPDANPNRRIDSNRKVVESPGIIQLARDRLRRSVDKTACDNRIDDIGPIATGQRLGPVAAIWLYSTGTTSICCIA